MVAPTPPFHSPSPLELQELTDDLANGERAGLRGCPAGLCTEPGEGAGGRAGVGAHMLLTVALQEEQVGRLIERVAHGVLAGLLGGSGAQAGLTG